MWLRRSWLKCRPVGKGNENDFAPEAEKGSRAFRVVLGGIYLHGMELGIDAEGSLCSDCG